MMKLTDCFFEEVYNLARLKEENNRSFLGKIIKYITSFDYSKAYTFSQIMRICVSEYKTSKKMKTGIAFHKITLKERVLTNL